MKTKTEKILYHKASLSPRPSPQIILKDSWQVQHKDYHERGTSTGRIAADEEKMEPNAAEQEEDDRIRLIGRLVHQVKNHPNRDSLIAELKNNRTYNSFGEKSEKMINMGNVEFELCEISSKIQGSVLLKVLNRRHRLSRDESF